MAPQVGATREGESVVHVDVFRYEPRRSVLQKVACAFIDSDEVRVKSTWDQMDYTHVIRSCLDSTPGSAEAQLLALPGRISTPYLQAVLVEEESPSEILLEATEYTDRYVGRNVLEALG